MTSSVDLPPYEPERFLAAPFPERVRLACRTWAAQITPNDPKVMALYWAKYFFVFILGWSFFVSFNDGYPGFTSPIEWAFSATAFQKAVAWSIFYELKGLGCGWGPSNIRIRPMTIGFRYFLRPGTTKLPLFPGTPVIGRSTRSWLDVGLYAVNQLLLLYVLIQPEVTPELLLPNMILIPVLGMMDKTLFLAARSEHYWVVLVCLVLGGSSGVWVSGCMMVWCFIWLWAGIGKVNHHFPCVIMHMMNNGPFFPRILKKHLFVSFPDDLRPSKFATTIAHLGAFTECMLPVLLLTSPTAFTTMLALCLVFSFHGFIALNNPNGMPIEWNIMMIYGSIFLFGFNGEASLLALRSAPPLLGFLVFFLVLVPCLGNFFPSKVSFLLSMRYYAGNWAYNVWLVRRGCSEKLKALVRPAPTMREQLEGMGLPSEVVETAVEMTPSHRFMHLEGRPLLEALPRAVGDIEDYEWLDGEVTGGAIIGWNFGDGHLNGKQLLDAVQEQCAFEEGELRMISVESQPLFGPGMEWKIYDAVTGLVEQGRTLISAEMRARPPYPTGEYADALSTGTVRPAIAGDLRS